MNLVLSTFKMPELLHLDFETYCDIDVREVGAQTYARHRSNEVLMMSWAFDDNDPQLWVPDGPWDYDSIPRSVKYHLKHGLPICAHNVEFEFNILWHVLGYKLPFESLHDTAALALIHGYPKSLAGVGAALELPVQKDKRGSLLIRKFCAPRKPTKTRTSTRNYPEDFPEDWEDFCNYCITDTVVEQEIWRRLIGP